MTQDILSLRKQKVKNEIETARRIEERGIHPLDVLDDLIKGVIDLMRVGILERNPNATEEQILMEMKEIVLFSHRLKQKR